MFLFDFFRSFLPLHNPIGFGASDFIELLLALTLAALVLARARLAPYVQRFAARTGWCMLLLALLPVVLRLALLPHHPAPIPSGSDEFSYLLVADTLLHGRLANPVHPLHQFFEAIFVVQEPSYSSIYPLGQGIALALGRLVFGHPWGGVLLFAAAFCSLCYWMLRGWTTPAWALAGGLLAVCEFGPLNQWMNSYWGGAVSATAGCLVFGSLPRLISKTRERARARIAVLLGMGLGIHLLTRPYESLLLLLSVMIFFLPSLRERPGWRRLGRTLVIVSVVVLPAIALTLLQNRAVSGNWTTLPYMLSRYQYGVPASLTFQPNPVPHRPLTAEQQLDYDVQSAVHGKGTDTLPSYFVRLEYRIRFYRFFFLAPIYVALPFYLVSLREFRYVWVALTLLIFAAGANFYPYFYPYYIAAVTCLCILVSVTGLERLSRLAMGGWPAGWEAARLVLFLCGAHFLFWYGFHLLADDEFTVAMGQYETWDFINYGDVEGRIAINHQLSELPGKQLVFVRYWPQHRLHEWIHNEADIDGEPVVRALDLGAAENEKLRRYYPDRKAWLLEPDAKPPKLSAYEGEGRSSPFETVR